MDIYVGGLPFRLSEDELKETFERYGSVSSVKIVKDRDTNRSKGFGFVIMDDGAEAKRAIAELDGTILGGRNIRVNEAQKRD